MPNINKGRKESEVRKWRKRMQITWNVKRKEILSVATVHTNHVQGRGSVASVFPIIWKWGSCLGVVFPKTQRPRGIGHLSILPAWFKQAKFRGVKGWWVLDRNEPKGIQELFQQLMARNQAPGESAKRLSALLVDCTLKYRDEMYLEKGIVVTVEDVQRSLSWLLPALFTGNIPQLANEIQDGLLRRWVSELTGADQGAQVSHE